MNISLYVYCKTERGLALAPRINNLIQRYLVDKGALPASTEFVCVRRGRSVFLNTDWLADLCRVPTLMQDDNCVISASALPIQLDCEISPQTYFADLKQRIERPAAMARLLPPFFLGFHSEALTGVYSDLLGLGRAYSLETNDFFVASNHIGACAFFDERSLESDEEAWDLFTAFGWLVGDTSPYKRIRRLPPATAILFDRFGNKREIEYFDYESLYRSRKPDPNEVTRTVDEMRQAVRNASNLACGEANVLLSGGRDSRVTTAAWISGGAPCRVTTIGILSKEAEVAAGLMKSGAPHVRHDITIPNSTTQREMLHESLESAMFRWDGDMNPNTVGRKNRANARPRSVTIGGGGGEIAHGNYYATAELLAKIRQMPNAADRLVRYFGNNIGVTSAAKERVEEFFANITDQVGKAGVSGPTVLDVFYLMERFRRWVAAGHHPGSIVLFACPGFVRLAMDQTPEDRLHAVAHKKLLNAFIPGWGDVPFFKAHRTDRDEKTEKGLRLWQGDQAEVFYDLLTEASRDSIWNQGPILEKAVEVLRGQASGRAEAIFEKVLWRHAFVKHHRYLRQRIQRNWERLREEAPALVNSYR